MNEKLSTEIIFQEIEKNGSVDRDKIDFVTREQTLLDLYHKIEATGLSGNKFAEMCDIRSSHFHEFLHGTKNLSRDNLIVVCIVLKLNIQETRKFLKSLIQSDFYPKNQRDFEIMCGIRQKKDLDSINDMLLAKGLNPLK